MSRTKRIGRKAPKKQGTPATAGKSKKSPGASNKFSAVEYKQLKSMQVLGCSICKEVFKNKREQRAHTYSSCDNGPKKNYNKNQGLVKSMKSNTLKDLFRRYFKKTVAKIDIVPVYKNTAHNCCLPVVGIWCQQVMAGVDLCDPTGEDEVLLFKERMRLMSSRKQNKDKEGARQRVV
ncbi:unnamed protein product [Allacma fusca]|uniref:Uncharacterized protein n=1 Tax=Allacma fusca TaxID=39272 RepID=A0A8J2JL01_9HEXA|nr:unnamed protein product [Allacma fusca]